MKEPKIEAMPGVAISAVLLSGGLDSAVLVAEEAARNEVQPIYVSVGLAWEAAEHDMLQKLVAHARWRNVRPLVSLSVDMTDVYPSRHWALRGQAPAYHTPDEDVYLPGRNVVLLGKAAVYCAVAAIPRLVLGTLDHNPFPDATPAFRSSMALALSLGLAHQIHIDAPFARVSKAEVIRRGVAHNVPLELTLSCMNPIVSPDGPTHCGTCSKCRERHDAFSEAGLPDPTFYDDRRFVDSLK